MKKIIAIGLAVLMLLGLTACGGVSEKSLRGSWYEEGSGTLMFQLYKNGSCDLYTYGIQSPGKWALEDGVLRMNTLINNERYTVESLKKGCLVVTDSLGRTKTFWDSQKKAVDNAPAATPESRNTGAVGTGTAITVPGRQS